MTAATARRCLVLNADFRPIGYPLTFITAQEAISAVWRDRAVVVEEWPDVFRSPSIEVRVPKVLALRAYAHVDPMPKFSAEMFSFGTEGPVCTAGSASRRTN